MLKNVKMDNQSSYQKVKHIEKDEEKHSSALTTVHKDLRLTWAKNHMTWSNEWHQVVWSDKKINLDGPDGFLTTGMICVKTKRFFKFVLKAVVVL